MSRYRAFIILLLDVLIIFLCNFLTMLPYLLGQDIRLLNLVLHIGLLTVCVLLFQVCLKTYDTLWRYAESREYLTLLEGMGLGFTLYSVVNLLLGTSRIWISSALTGTALALLVMLGYRFVYRSYRRRVTGVGGGPRAYAAIIGAGSAGAALVSEMDDRIYGRYRRTASLMTPAEKQQKRIHGVPVLGPIDAMEEILADTPVTDIISHPRISRPSGGQEILNLCARTQRRVHVLGSPVTRLHARQGDYIRRRARGGDRGSARPRAGAAGKSAHRDVPARQDRARDGRRRVDRLGALPPDRGEPAGAARDPRRGGEHDL